MNLKKLLIIASILVISHYSLVTPSHAINMQSNDYRIQFGKVDIGGGKMDDLVNDSYHLTSSIGQEAAKEFQSNGYIVKAGFQYIYSRIPFSFYLSTARVDLGTLLPNSPKTGDIILKVSFGGAGQYIVTVRADAPLTRIQGTDTIPFTKCDAGDCGITSATSWIDSSVEGFGYGMAGQDVSSDFSGNTLLSYTYFRPFSNKLTLEAAAPIMQSSNVTADITPTPPAIPYTPAPALTGVPRNNIHQAVIRMKANVSVIQSAGTYATVIRFLATPSF